MLMSHPQGARCRIGHTLRQSVLQRLKRPVFQPAGNLYPADRIMMVRPDQGPYAAIDGIPKQDCRSGKKNRMQPAGQV